MSYQALYRTWRPEFFRDVVGQDRIVTTLRNQITSGRIPHAYLFCGSRGTGKTSTAKVLSRAVNCLEPEDGEPCGRCAACLQLAGENNLDIVEIDAASNNGVDEIRDLREKVKYPPTVGRYKVYIIDEVHMLSSGAFNALLKTLEEPPAHAVFILATTEPQRLPATILSRCQRFDFKRIPAALIEKRLKQVLEANGNEAEDEAVSLVARAAEGGMRDALSILDMCLSYGGGRLAAPLVREVLGASDRRFLFDFADALIQGDAPRALTMIDRLMRDGRDPAVFAREVTGHARALLVARACETGLEDILEITGEDAGRMRAQAQGASEPRLMRVMSLFIQAENDMKWSSQQRIVLELCAVRACHPEREQGEEALEDRLYAVEKALAEGVRAAPAAPSAPGAKATVPAAPKEGAGISPPPPRSAPVPENDEQAWQQAFKAIGRQDPKICIFLRKGRFAGADGDQALLEYPLDGGEVLMKLLAAPEKRAVVDQCLSEAFGREMHLQTVQPGAPVRKTAAPDGKRNLERVYEAFPREKIEIIDE
ncbi:MAG: DNA polymerase III subunit gamma/tau [Clostridia bacterium]|nr:DNA polymerase III subunit gamma/tau [Clostridia bacterium]